MTNNGIYVTFRNPICSIYPAGKNVSPRLRGIRQTIGIVGRDCIVFFTTAKNKND